MRVWHCAEDLVDLGKTVVTIGIFDGVHRGHHAVLRETVFQARERGLTPVALTFDPHPTTIHRPDVPVHLIATLGDRLDRLESAGIEGVFVQHYDRDYAQTSPEDFLNIQVKQQLKAAAVVVGEDVRYGKNNVGDAEMLLAFGEANGIAVTLVRDLCDDGGRRWSSTWIRELLSRGDVAEAAKVLGRPHRLRGVVEHGFKRGRELGFPTANLPGEGIGEIPADGVYAGWLIQNVPHTKATVHLPAAISIGTNPQFDGEERTVEAHVLGRSDLNLYGEEVAIDLIDYVRPMLKLDSVDDLLNQMDEDLRKTAEILGVPVAYRVDPAEVTAS